MSNNPNAPWKEVEAFPEKPAAQDFGYILRGKPVGCSREELIRRCGSQDLPAIQLVWHPDAPRVVPATHVLFLLEPLRKRTKRGLQTNLWIGVFNTFRGLRALERAPVEPSEPREGAHHFAVWVGSRRILFTWILLGAILIVAVFQLISGPEHSIEAAGLDKTAVRHGDWWRLFTAPMMHAGIWHLLFNATALAGLGRLMEMLASRYHLALIFGLSAVTGRIFSLLLLPHETSVGASGGLLGLIGFLCVKGVRRRTVLPAGLVKSIALNIAIIAAIGLIAYAMIDNAWHLGGLLAGMVTGLLLINRNDQTLPLPSGAGLKLAGTLAQATMPGFAGFGCVRMLTR